MVKKATQRGWSVIAAMTLALATAFAGTIVPASAVPVDALVAANASSSSIEGQIATLINRERTSRGLKPLTVSASISTVSRNWSTTMGVGQENGTSNYFRHNPNFSSQIPSGWRHASENIAWASSRDNMAQFFVRMWMDSSGHRANILRADNTHMGVGVYRNARGNYFATQNFAQYPAGVVVDPSTVTPNTPFVHILLSPDLDSDGRGDVVAVDRSGRLFVYPGTASGGLGKAHLAGRGFSGLTPYMPGDFDGDGRADLMVRDSSGRLFLFSGNGNKGFTNKRQIGTGWRSYRIVPVGDLNSDRRPDLLAIDSAGRLWLYPGNGRGGFLPRRQVGTGWTGFELHAAGVNAQTGKVDIFGIDPQGRLWRYPGRGDGAFNKRVQVGRGWGTYTMASGGDLNADGYYDLIGRDDNSGRLFRYLGTRQGGFIPRVQVGTGW